MDVEWMWVDVGVNDGENVGLDVEWIWGGCRGECWVDVGGCGVEVRWLWVDVGGCGRMWVDVG